jgi:VIT1/CCC1 family predicted Fe2+/Mn2+ transporter
VIRFLVEVINFIGCLFGGMLSLIGFVLVGAGIALLIVLIAVALVAWAFFAAAYELYKAHGPKEATS